ncbi:CCR4-NOT regulatory complex component [Puccinia graminis f. sp. tritici]|uniref:ABC transporter domain-containing protein n=2 Tax=Puccinia graminis f. sp. tritici TaxID=56615 RepID=E3K9R1_PUCGT|nr:uncharacterized protein PGTG_07187 [Puccinia graminis f. sp. tritici CRL 75-36-700-3]EFP80935.1 hypothetical protein PGTG_07187 [Puccinia graminis f. sp. tritici CRL 75-36-700-3]KAA1068870.1 CCR4-NOT regulatory complex component [Puccinia graminis f. sp. tritici]
MNDRGQPELAATPAVEVSKLFFRFNPESLDVLRDVNLDLERGSRCLLIGANGAGKSTLLQILAGKRMSKSKAKALGEDVFFNTPAGVAYLGTEWASNSVVRSDLVVSHFLDSVGGYRHKSRRDRLLNILDVDLDWHMHQISDGERRRVQIVQGLMAPWNLLLLDEVTVDLDVMVRQELLQFLIEDTKTRDCTVVYATHIFDGLDNFPTHVCHLQIGSTTTPKPIPWPISPETAVQNDCGIPPEALHEIASPDRIGSKLLVLALHWLKEDRLIRLKLEAQGDPAFKKRGALPESSVPTDSEVFYRKYDYTNSA